MSKKLKRKYGDKRDYRKIEIFVDGDYVATTTWAKTCKEAKKVYAKTKKIPLKRVKARFATKRRRRKH